MSLLIVLKLNSNGDMMKKYNPVEGVPVGHYFLSQILAFADFEVDQQEKILFTSENKQDLIDYCSGQGQYLSLDGGWATAYIKQRLI